MLSQFLITCTVYILKCNFRVVRCSFVFPVLDQQTVVLVLMVMFNIVRVAVPRMALTAFMYAFMYAFMAAYMFGWSLKNMRTPPTFLRPRPRALLSRVHAALPPRRR